MSEPVIWQGKELPPRKPGHVWAMYMYPGGGKELRQCTLDRMHYASEAIERLQSGYPAHVWLDDVEYVNICWRQEQETEATA